MPSDYVRISEENRQEYGSNLTGWRDRLLLDLYEDRTHFIFELLQNAEDALRRRSGGSGRVSFALTHDAVCFSHFGDPFTTDDVRGVSAIALGLKETDLTAIGRFGIGFKSVYAITDRPEIHSGDEHFTVSDYVQPAAVPAIALAEGETVITLSLREIVDADDIARQFERLGEARTLLFLRGISEIEWAAEDGRSGSYRREELVEREGVRRVTLLGEANGEAPVEETWLVFSRNVHHKGKSAGFVELAFRITRDEDGANGIEVIHDSRLTAFFPTGIETHLGMLVQGPYRTTPARDNIPRDDEWNRHLVGETAELLVDALRHLRDERLLTAPVFEGLPLDRDQFSEGSLLAPLFDAVRDAVRSEPLLPAHRGGYVSARQARLTDRPGVRNLISRRQLVELLDEDEPVAWLAGGISRRHTAKFHRYLTQEQGVRQVDLSDLLWWLRSNDQFLAAQPDHWISNLYSFLGREGTQHWQLAFVPFIRLEGGTQVAPGTSARPVAFLPTEPPSGYPNTVRRAVCDSRPAREFLKSLGLRDPDLVDDVLSDILQRYEQDNPAIPDDEYEAHVQRILGAFDGASREQRVRLTAALRDTSFVRVVDAGTGERSFVRPRDAYLATRSLRALFGGVPSVLLVGEPLQREDVTRLLDACGASRTLAVEESVASGNYDRRRPRDEFWEPFGITSDERSEMRRQASQGRITRNSRQVLTNREYRGVEVLLNHLSTLPGADAAARAKLLWDALRAAPRKGFEGTYVWTHYGDHTGSFDSTAIRLLNSTAWVPDGSGGLQTPDRVEFASLGWTQERFLESVIKFRQPEAPSVLATLAEEAGVDLEGLEAFKEAQDEGFSGEDIREAARELRRRRDTARPAPGGCADAGGDGAPAGPRGFGGLTPVTGGKASAGEGVPGDVERTGAGETEGGGNAGGRVGGASGGNTRAGATRSRFVSYISVSTETEGDPDPDGLGNEERMALEEAAITLILDHEPTLRRTPANNPGYDLYEADGSGAPVRWVEVKAISGDWGSRPVALTHTQFDLARQKGEAYWLYVVERAGSDDANVVRIANPAGRSSTYTLDEGWRGAPPEEEARRCEV